MKGRVLIVEDNPDLAFGLRNNLEIEGYEVRVAEDGPSGVQRILEWKPDLVILDLMLPGMDGYRVLRTVREAGFRAPVLMLTARGQESDKVLGLRSGADDYVTKPFGDRELRARVRAQLRRARMRPTDESSAPLVVGDLSIDVARRQVSRGGAAVHLTPTEWGLLVALVTNAGKTMTHRQLFRAVWGDVHGDAHQYLRVYVAHLRRKIEQDAVTPRYIITEPGVGYRFESGG